MFLKIKKTIITNTENNKNPNPKINLTFERDSKS